MVELEKLDGILSQEDLDFFGFTKTGVFGNSDVYSNTTKTGTQRILVEPTYIDDIYLVKLKYETDSNNYVKKAFPGGL